VIDGRDLSPVLFGKSTVSPREAHYYFNGYNLQAVRQGPWKLSLAALPNLPGEPIPADGKKTPRLYNLETDVGETKDVADQHPDIVEKLKALAAKMDDEIGGKSPKSRRPAGVVANPKPLYETDEAPKAKDVAARPAAIDSLKPGDAIPSAAAPQIGGKAITISCLVDTSLRDTIVLAHGGRAAGYALHLKDGRVVFSVRTGAKDSIAEATSAEPIQGPTKIVAKLAADGTLSLTVGEQAAVTAKAPGLIPRQPAEDFCLGHDNGQPVANYSAKAKPFEGKIVDLKIGTP
jgi:hypothetical protein